MAIEAGIGSPAGIAVYPTYNLYLANEADRVRKVEAATGIITTVAGADGSRHSGDGWLAVHAQFHQPSAIAVDSEGNLYIAARGEHRIRKVSAATGIITTIAGVSQGTDSGVLSMVVYRSGFKWRWRSGDECFAQQPERNCLGQSGKSLSPTHSTIAFAGSTRPAAL